MERQQCKLKFNPSTFYFFYSFFFFFKYCAILMWISKITFSRFVVPFCDIYVVRASTMVDVIRISRLNIPYTRTQMLGLIG